MRLYDARISGNAYKVRLLLHQLGLEAERVELDLERGETRTPAFLEKNPNGRVPVLELDDGSCLSESNAILVADRYSVADIALYAYTHVAHEGGFDLAPFALVRAWLDRVRSQPGHVTIDA